jgi:hypothetical protein
LRYLWGFNVAHEAFIHHFTDSFDLTQFHSTIF